MSPTEAAKPFAAGEISPPGAAPCSACTAAQADAAAKCVADLKSLGRAKWLESACKYKDDYLTCITKDSAGCCTETIEVDFKTWTDDLGSMVEHCNSWKTCQRCTGATGSSASSVATSLLLATTMSIVAYVMA